MRPRLPSNPWLGISAADYEGHMNSPEVGQLQALNDLFAEALATYQPRSLAVVGCATGNGLEHVDPVRTERVVGIDINPDYLAVARERLAGRLPHLELVEQDCASPFFRMAPVEMVFAALVFEYMPVARAVANIGRSRLRVQTERILALKQGKALYVGAYRKSLI